LVVNKLCSSILVFHPLLCLIYNYHSSMYTWQNIPPHHDILYAMCQRIFLWYSFDVNKIFLKRFGPAHLFMLTCSHSCSHIHHLASLLQSMNNKIFVGDQWLCIVTQVFEGRMLGTIHATKLQMEFLYWAWRRHNCNWSSCKHNAT